MINSIKSQSILWIKVLVIILLTSCSKNDDGPTTITTYRLTLNAIPPAEGNTIFSTISYNNEDGTTETLSDTSSPFEESFDIAIGYTISFNVSGTNDAANQPSPTINWAVNKFENNIDKGIICYGSSVSVMGNTGSWSFSSNNNSTFDGTSCN